MARARAGDWDGSNVHEPFSTPNAAPAPRGAREECFYLKLGTAAKGTTAQCGACVAVQRPGAEKRFPAVSLLQSAKLWQKSYFYIKNLHPTLDYINLLAYVAGLPVEPRTNCRYKPSTLSAASNAALARLQVMTESEGLKGSDLLAAYVARRVLPLQAQPHIISRMSGHRDPCRMCSKELPDMEVARCNTPDSKTLAISLSAARRVHRRRTNQRRRAQPIRGCHVASHPHAAAEAREPVAGPPGPSSPRRRPSALEPRRLPDSAGAAPPPSPPFTRATASAPGAAASPPPEPAGVPPRLAVLPRARRPPPLLRPVPPPLRSTAAPSSSSSSSPASNHRPNPDLLSEKDLQFGKRLYDRAHPPPALAMVRVFSTQSATDALEPGHQYMPDRSRSDVDDPDLGAATMEVDDATGGDGGAGGSGGGGLEDWPDDDEEENEPRRTHGADKAGASSSAAPTAPGGAPKH
nr:serine/arginine repetitive matrix protein 1-like [Aegilops tauschii subsp. strangulata]